MAKSCSNCDNLNTKGNCNAIKQGIQIVCPQYPELHLKQVKPAPDFYCKFWNKATEK